MKEEIDRYRRLLQEWGGDTQGGLAQDKPQPQATPPRFASSSATTPSPGLGARAKLARAQVTPEPDGRFPCGSILVLNDEELVIYRRPVAGQPVDMVYSLLADGTSKIEAVDLAAYQIFEMGCLSPEALKTLQNQMVWNRALIAPHCSNPADADRIPEPSGPGPVPSSTSSYSQQSRRTPPPADSRSGSASNGLRGGDSPEDQLIRGEGAGRVTRGALDSEGRIRIRRGQRIILKFGSKSWEAVYWGRDQTGPVVAHSTHKHWQLMHLDLNRFRDCMIADEEPSEELVDEIMRELSTKMS